MDIAISEELISQIRLFHYRDQMDIFNLLNHPARQVVPFIPDINDVAENHRVKSSGAAREEADDTDDDSQEHPKINPAGVH